MFKNRNPETPSRGDLFLLKKIIIQKHNQVEAFYIFKNQTFYRKEGLPLRVFLDRDFFNKIKPPLEGIFGFIFLEKKKAFPRRCRFKISKNKRPPLEGVFLEKIVPEWDLIKKSLKMASLCMGC